MTYLNQIIKINDIITFHFKLKNTIYKTLLRNVKGKRFFVQPPFYLEMNYRTLSVLLIPKLISSKFIPYPFFFKKDD